MNYSCWSPLAGTHGLLFLEASVDSGFSLSALGGTHTTRLVLVVVDAVVVVVVLVANSMDGLMQSLRSARCDGELLLLPSLLLLLLLLLLVRFATKD
jgi:hypothetical protein